MEASVDQEVAEVDGVYSPAMTEREILIALFDAISAVYEVLKGHPLAVKVETANGQLSIIGRALEGR
jgi:hypothetical protein